MSAWTKLLAASSLAVGNAWALISSPRAGGGATVYVEQISATVADDTITAQLQDDALQVQIADATIFSTVTVIDAQTNLPDGTITVETT